MSVAIATFLIVFRGKSRCNRIWEVREKEWALPRIVPGIDSLGLAFGQPAPSKREPGGRMRTPKGSLPEGAGTRSVTEGVLPCTVTKQAAAPWHRFGRTDSNL